MALPASAKSLAIFGLNLALYQASVWGRVTTLCVTNHMTPEDVAGLGFEQAPSVQAALSRAREIAGPGAKVGIIPFGGETLTQVNQN